MLASVAARSRLGAAAALACGAASCALVLELLRLRRLLDRERRLRVGPHVLTACTRLLQVGSP